MVHTQAATGFLADRPLQFHSKPLMRVGGWLKRNAPTRQLPQPQDGRNMILVARRCTA